jgi:hypothetical protein
MHVINCIPGCVYFLISDQKIQYGANWNIVIKKKKLFYFFIYEYRHGKYKNIFHSSVNFSYLAN